MTDTVTLGNVEPLYTPYEKPEVYDPEPKGTVAGQIPGILASGSPYMQAADLKGKQYVSSRGLINSSMGAEASQKAAIEAALPIAQQDANTFATAGMKGFEGEVAGALSKQSIAGQSGISLQESRQRAGLSTQEAAQRAGLSTQEAAQRASLSTQEAAQQKKLTELQGLIQRDLSAQEAAQRLGLSAQEAGQVQKLAAYQADVQRGLSTQEAAQRAGLSTQEAAQQKKLTEFQGLIQRGLSAQEAAQRLGLSAQEAGQVQKLAAYQADVQRGLSTQEAAQRAGLSTQEAAQAIALTVRQAGLISGLSEQEAAQEMAIKQFQEAATTSRQEAELTVNERISAMDLSSGEVKAVGSAVTLLGQTLSEQIGRVQVDPALSADAKTTIVNQLIDTYRANVDSVASIYGVPITWN